MAKLGECFSVIRNGASIRQTDGAGGFPITRIETIADQTINREKFGYGEIYDLAQYRDYILQDGDILMSHINSEKHLGKVALYSKQDDEQIIHGMNLLMLRADTQKVIPEYAKYYFESQKFLRQIGRITKKSVNQASFTVTALKELEIPLASIIVQRDISEKLKKVDWLVSLRKQQLAKLDELVKARFVEMFGDPYVNNKHYPLRKGESFFKLSNGKGVPEDKRLSNGVPAYGGNGISWYTNESLFNYDTIVVGRVGFQSGNVHIAKGPLWITDNAMYMSSCDFSQYNLIFLINLMEHIDFTRFQDAGDLKKITQKPFMQYEYLCPPLSLQNQFAAFVERVNQQKQTVQQSLEKLKLMKKALMQEYFG